MDTLLLISILILVFGLVSERLHTTFLTPPMVFVSVGLVVGSGVLGSFESFDNFEVARELAEITLVIVLFTDASRISLRDLRQNFRLPLRMLGIGMPLSIVVGTALAAWMFPSLGLWGAAVLAACLAPTDAALGQAVVSSPVVPARIRQALNVESGLNDGLALPFVLLTIALASVVGEAGDAGDWTRFVVLQLVFGPLVGIAVGYFGGKLVEWGSARGWMSHSFQQLSAIALALLAFLLAEPIGGNGFIAAFVAGLTLGNVSRSVLPVLQEFAETEGQFLALLSFLCFGAHLIWPLLGDITAPIIVYALLSLTVVRMLPVALSMLGLGFRGPTLLFLGWFGPRGLATVIFVLPVLDEELPGGELIFTVALTTVMFSVFLHGATAWWGARRYARFCKKADMPENEPVTEMPVRIRLRDGEGSG